MNIRTTAASLALAAGSLLFVAQPALHAQEYYNDGRYYGARYDNRDYRDSYDDRDYRAQRAIEHDRQEINRDLARGDYGAARREARELEKRERKLARDRYRRHREYREDDRYWNR